MITVISGFDQSVYFSSCVPDVAFSLTSDSASVVMNVDEETVYSETLYAVGGIVNLRDLVIIVSPYARRRLQVYFELTVTEKDTGDTLSLSAKVLYCRAEIGMEAYTFVSKYFLSVLMGTKTTSIGRLEYLHYWGDDKPSVEATYSDGTVETLVPRFASSSPHFTTIDVSPAQFQIDSRKLVSYNVRAGMRSQRFDLDLSSPDCAPVLLFVNAFGCEELAYCTGTHSVAPTYKRSSAYLDGLRKNYQIEETRNFKADTGCLNMAMASWFDELFRSDYIRVVNFYDGTPQPGKEIIVTESKSEYSNEDDELPRFTFTYQYAQRNHQVLDFARAGRIFDNTFDYTFN